MADESSDPGLITGNMIEAMIQAKLLVNAEQVAEAYRTVYATVLNPFTSERRGSLQKERWQELK